MQLFKKYCLLILMLVMVAQAQQSVSELYQAAKKGDSAAFAELKALGNKGNADAQRNLGLMYVRGEGVPKDLAEALRWHKKAAENGSDDARTELAELERTAANANRPRNDERSESNAMQVEIVAKRDTQQEFVVSKSLGDSLIAAGDAMASNQDPTLGMASVIARGVSAAERSTSRPRLLIVRGAVLVLKLRDGRLANVACESKYAPQGNGVNRRSCRIPGGNQLWAEFQGDKAKLTWLVSLDGSKVESETYNLTGITNQP